MTQNAMTAVGVRPGPMPTGGRWDWYRDHEGGEWRRVSKLLKYVETDTYNLDRWRERQVAEGLALRDDLVLAVKAMGRPDPIEGWSAADKKKLNGITRDAMNAAKQTDGGRKGTAMHDLTERLDRGEDLENVVRGLPAQAAQSLRAYDFLRRANGWVTVEVERTVVIDELDAAGTFDRVDVVPGLASLLGPGECQYGDACPDAGFHMDAKRYELPVIMDVKTEKDPLLNALHIAPQLGSYSRAKRMWVPTGGTVKVRFSKTGDEVDMPAGKYVRAPCVRQDVGVMVHVANGEATPYFVDLTRGWEAAQAAHRQMLRENASKTKLGEPGAWFVAMPNVQRPAPAQMVTEQAVAANYAGAAQEAVKRPDGNYDWKPVAGQLDEVDRSAIEAIWAATATGGPGQSLEEVYRIYTQVCGREWGGRVAEAAAARQRQIECPQRSLHTSGKCACGWAPGVPA